MSVTVSESSSSPITPEDVPSRLRGRRSGPSDEDVLTWCLGQYKRCKDARSKYEQQWYINMAFYDGKQNARIARTAASSNNFQLVIPPAPPYRVRLVINRVRGIVRTTLAKATSQKPRFTVVPATSEDNDVSSARVAEQIFDAVYSDKNIKRVVRRACFWTIVCGTGYIKTYWDPDAIDTVSDQQGDISIEHITPFHVFVPDLREEDLERQPYIIHATMKSRDWAEHNFKGKKFVATKAADDILQDSFLNMAGVNEVDKDQLHMLEFWIKPGNKLFPEGGMVQILGQQVVQVINGYPYDHGMYPFAKIDGMASGRFYGESAVTDLISIQREYNRRRSQIIEAANLMGKPKLLYAQGSIDPNKITSEPGQGIPYKPGFNPPQQLQLAPLPNHVMQEVQQLQDDLNELGGATDMTRGSNPSQVTAATALSYLQEQNDTKLSDTIGSLEEAMEKIGRTILAYVSEFWTTERVVRIMGADGSFDAQQYKGSSIGGNLDVRVEAGSALPQSKAAKQAFVMDLMKMLPQFAEKGLEMLEIGGIEKIYDEYLTDKRQAQRENMRMSEGEPLDINEWDNHEVHIQVHNLFRKSQEFETFPEELQAVFQAHVDLHYMATGKKPGPGVPLVTMPAVGEGPGGPNMPPAGPPAEEMAGQAPPGQEQLDPSGQPAPPM